MRRYIKIEGNENEEKEKDMGTKQRIDLNSPKQNKCMDHSPK